MSAFGGSWSTKVNRPPRAPGTIYVVSAVGHGTLASDHSGSDADVQAAPAAKAGLATHRNPAGPGAGDLSTFRPSEPRCSRAVLPAGAHVAFRQHT